MTLSVIGQETGIAHGTVKGYWQHSYRKVPATQECGCLEAVREDNARRSNRPAKPCTQEQRAWYGGQFAAVTDPDAPRPRRQIHPPGECSQAGCGQAEPARAPLPTGWVTVRVAGSRQGARRYCSGSCATVGIALAELRMDDDPAHTAAAPA